MYPVARQMMLMEKYGINKVLDVGANAGQYGKKIRRYNSDYNIVSFEPLSSAYSKLCGTIARDDAWTAVNYALGESECSAEINIAGNSQSSSLLEMNQLHKEVAPDSGYIGAETVNVKTLDNVFSKFVSDADRVYLKIDAQGYERNILDGAEESLKRITGIQVESPLVELYAGEMLLSDMVDYLSQRGFTLCSIEPGFGDPRTGRMLQADCIYFRI